MKTYNSPAQARSLREIEAEAASPVKNIISEVYGTIQPVHTAEEVEEEREKTETKIPTKKTRKKKNTKEI
jgi:hypothetical protein